METGAWESDKASLVSFPKYFGLRMTSLIIGNNEKRLEACLK
jgi:hypothetical protein